MGPILHGASYTFNPLVIPPALTAVAVLGLGIAALWWAKIAYLGVPFIPAAAYHFTVTVVRRVPSPKG